MLQSFDDIADPSVGRPRVAALRSELARAGLDGFIVPRADEHQGEYVPDRAARLRWLTGFAGSAGTAVVLTASAALFVDARYTLQAQAQSDTALFEIREVPPAKLSVWLGEHAGKGARIGYDPKLHTAGQIEALEKALKPSDVKLVSVEENLIDRTWQDRPASPLGLVTLQPEALAGQSAVAKLATLRADLSAAGEDAVVLTNADSIAWLFNLRGADVPRTPFALSFAVVEAKGPAVLYIDPRKIGGDVRGALSSLTELRHGDELQAGLRKLGADRRRVRLDPDSAAEWFFRALKDAGAEIARGADPCALPKARKNDAELAGARAAHKRDAVAVARFLAWLDREAGSGRLDEIAAAQHLEACRRDSGKLLDLAFETIAGAGPNAALPHYRVSRKSNRRLEQGSVFLVDSGGQYQDGTTDITRTIAIGAVPEEMQRAFTLVLKGMIAISVAKFPKGTRGQDLDPFARRALWSAGLDFDHGTGHGVGSYLSVHEGPQRLSRTGEAVLEPGMILSNEPGYYKPGHFGIRIENLVVVMPAGVPPAGERPMHAFETLTLAPIDHHMIVRELLSDEEWDWLDGYHERVVEEIGPELDDADLHWLELATRPLS